MLTHSGHGSVTALKPNITQTKDVSPQCARVMIRRITGSAALGKDQLDVGAACPQCDHPVGSPESILGAPLCALSEWRTEALHACGTCVGHYHYLVDGWCPQELHYPAGEKGLRSCDHTRPGDIVALDFFGLGRHLVIDAVVSTVYRNTILSKTSTIPGYVAKLAEDKKFKADEKSPEPVSSKHGGDHVFVPFAMEDGGTLGAHALALLKMLSEYAV